MGPQGGAGGLVPDHKHSQPPEPRALLCHNCNAGLGQFKDSPEICRAAAEYLEAWCGD
jgi:Recombination endonuclease VII